MKPFNPPGIRDHGKFGVYSYVVKKITGMERRWAHVPKKPDGSWDKMGGKGGFDTSDEAYRHGKETHG